MTKTIAHATGVAEPTVAMFVRELRVAGLLTTGARGVNAPHMRPLDAARVLIALLVSNRPIDAPKAVRDFGDLRCSAIQPRAVGPMTDAITLDLPERHRFEDGLAFVIQAYARAPWTGGRPPFLTVSANVNDMQAGIELLTFKHFYYHHALLDLSVNWQQTTMITSQEDKKIIAEVEAAKRPYNASKIRRPAEFGAEVLVPISAEFRE